jgi:putative Holliday junction resolvase
MPKILGIDYGVKRTGIAITDALCIIGSPLTTVLTADLFNYLDDLFRKESIDTLVLGEAKRLNGEASDITHRQEAFAQKLTKKYPDKKIVRVDETFTSKMAAQSLVMSGMKKSDRQKKENLDMVSAAIILQSYLDSRQ